MDDLQQELDKIMGDMTHEDILDHLMYGGTKEDDIKLKMALPQPKPGRPTISFKKKEETVVDSYFKHRHQILSRSKNG